MSPKMFKKTKKIGTHRPLRLKMILPMRKVCRVGSTPLPALNILFQDAELRMPGLRFLTEEAVAAAAAKLV